MKPFTILSSVFLLLQLISFTISQSNYLHSYCSDGVNYTESSTYRKNLNTLLSSFSTSNITGFFTGSAGNPPNRVNGVVLCRGDVSLENCRSCANDSTIKIPQMCPNQMEAIGYYDFCLLRYTNRSIFGVVNQGDIPTYYMNNPENVRESQLEEFNQVLQSLMSNLSSSAAAGDSRKKFATGSAVSGFYTIYGLMQCTPDLSGWDCENCLVRAVSEIPVFSAGRIGGRVIKPNCNLRFETYRFYEITPPPVAPLPPPGEQPPTSLGSSPSLQGGESSKTIGAILIIVLPIVAGAILVIGIFFCLRIRKPKRKLEGSSYKDADEIEDVSLLQFSLETIRAATNDFSNQNKLGQGGFGAVYKGTLSNRQEIAVKRLSENSGQGDLEFKNEVLLVAKLQHRNLVRLLGFCLEGTERLLIYEFVPNASLDYFIFDSVKRTKLDWNTRNKIIGGIAKGLLYLHEDSRLRIIHRDMKASNILLDDEMNPKIADFGMARLVVLDQTQGNTSRIAGTYGYMAPEYAMHGQFSVKSDVYSFGVLILEIVSGQKNNCFRNGEDVEDLLSYAWKNRGEGTYMNIVDPSLAKGSSSEIMRCIHIGLLCVQENVADRPTMDSVVLMLNSYSLTLPIPSKPAFFMHSNIESGRILSSVASARNISWITHSSSQGDNIVPLSMNDASITELYGR